ncbi:MAG: lipid II flippase MurJ, partial [Gammaproteobacteria bacterium]
TKTPVRIGIIALVANMGYNLLFVLPLMALDFVAPHTGLAIASSLSAWQQAWMLHRELGRRSIYQVGPDIRGFLLRTLPALVAMGLLLTTSGTLEWTALGAAGRVGWLLAFIVLGALVYAIGLLAAGIRPRHLASP